MSRDIWSEIFCFQVCKPSEEELKSYQDYYENVLIQRDLLYKAKNAEECGAESAAFNFLYHLRVFKMNVPKKIRKKKYEKFEVTEDLAKEILRDCLCNKNK
jgi:hypothetical protein